MTDEEPILIRQQATSQEDAAPPEPQSQPAFVDRRTEAQATIQKKPRWAQPGVRPWSKITGVCLHQTACEMGENDARYDNINVHFVVCRSGKILWMYDLTALLAAANRWNDQTVSIEVDGLYAGLEDDPSTVKVNEAMRTTWDDPSTPFRETPQKVTPEAMESTRQLVRWIVAEVERHGGKVGVLVAHRQSSGNRESDPGQAIWQEVAIPLLAELELSDGGPGFQLDDGRGLPDEWTGMANGIPY